MQARQRVGDGVAAEHRASSAGRPGRRPPRRRRRRPPTARSPSAPWPVIRSQTRPSAGRRRRGRGRACRAPRAGTTRSPRRRPPAARAVRRGRVEIDCIGELSAVHPVEELRGPARVPSGRARALDLDHGGAGQRQQLAAQRPRPHRRQVDHQQVRQDRRFHPPGPAVGRWVRRRASRRAHRQAGRAGGRARRRRPRRGRARTVRPWATDRRRPHRRRRTPPGPGRRRRRRAGTTSAHTNRRPATSGGWRRPPRSGPDVRSPRSTARPAEHLLGVDIDPRQRRQGLRRFPRVREHGGGDRHGHHRIIVGDAHIGCDSAWPVAPGATAHAQSLGDGVDEAPLKRRDGVDRSAGQHKIRSAPTPDPAGDAYCPPGAGNQAQAELR